MKLYIAAPWVARHEAKHFASLCEAQGHTITEKWWDHPEVDSYPAVDISDDDQDALIQQAERDIKGVLDADRVIVLQLAKSEGKAFEQGVAYMAHKPVSVVSPSFTVGHVFQYLDNVDIFDSQRGALDVL